MPSAAAGDEVATVSSPITQGALTCFSIDPPTGSQRALQSCDDYCEDNGAICTGVTSAISPAQSCADPAQHFQIVCRCCSVKR